MRTITRKAAWLALPFALLLFAAFVFFGPPLPAAGVDCDVYAGDLEKVAAIGFTKDGRLFATLEKSAGRGELVEVTAGDRVDTRLAGLDKPDGLVVRDDGLFITLESGTAGLLAFRDSSTRYYDAVHNGEGIANAANGRLLVVEDRDRDGRLLTLDTSSGDTEVLLSGLSDAEGVCAAPDGRIWFVEKGSAGLSQLSAGVRHEIPGELVKPAFLSCLDDGSVLITEDRTNFGRLVRYGAGEFRVLVRHLRAPQGAVVGPDKAYYIAEQNRNRILRCEGV